MKPLQREIRLQFIPQGAYDPMQGQNYRVEILSPLCGRIHIPFNDRHEPDMIAKCELRRIFLDKLATRTEKIIEATNSENSLEAFAKQNNLDPLSPDTKALHDQEQRFLSDMDVWFDDAETFLSAVRENRHNVFGYAIMSETPMNKPGHVEKSNLVMVYMGNEYVAALPLDSEENRQICDELMQVCRNSNQEVGDVRFHEIIQKMIPVCEHDYFEESFILYPVENEVSEERPYFDSRQQQRSAPQMHI